MEGNMDLGMSSVQKLVQKNGEGASSYHHRKGHFEPLPAALLDDPILADVPKKPTVADVDSLIGVELGSAMRLSIRKMDNTTFDVAVLSTASVRELKAALQKKVDSVEQSQIGHRHISWKHVWVNFSLTYNNEKLLDDDAKLRQYGIKNNDQLNFARHIPSSGAREHSRAKKRRFFHGLRKSISFNMAHLSGPAHNYQPTTDQVVLARYAPLRKEKDSGSDATEAVSMKRYRLPTFKLVEIRWLLPKLRERACS